MSQRRKRETKMSSLAHENTVVFLVSILGFTETSESEDGDWSSCDEKTSRVSFPLQSIAVDYAIQLVTTHRNHNEFVDRYKIKLSKSKWF